MTYRSRSHYISASGTTSVRAQDPKGTVDITPISQMRKMSTRSLCQDLNKAGFAQRAKCRMGWRIPREGMVSGESR